jgi:transcriptional regulator with XRE-family HTH domain
MKTDVLNSLVTRSGLSREDIASRMGITRMQLYRLLNNPSRMRIGQMILLADILNKSPRHIITLIKSI